MARQQLAATPAPVLAAMLRARDRATCDRCGAACDGRALVKVEAVAGALVVDVTCWGCRQERAA